MLLGNVMSIDFLDELGELALGSRLKRLSERMLNDAAQIYQYFGVEVQPKWFTLLALLDKRQKVSVVEASEYLGLSQPALSQFCRQLQQQQYITLEVDKRDSRKRVIALSKLGQQQVEKMQPMWRAVDRAAKDMCREYENHFYQALLKLEKSHNHRSLLERTKDYMMSQTYSSLDPNQVTIVECNAELAHYFESINRQWIESMFVLEEIDIQVLQHPKKMILDKGGKIWFAQHPDLGVVGTCALLNKGDGAYELTKMGVLESARGLKVGEKLLRYVIESAKQMSVNKLFLLTNAKCEAAIHLYEKNGFEHDEQIMQRYGALYERCDVAMNYPDI